MSRQATKQQTGTEKTMTHSHRSVTIDLLRHGEVAAPPAFFGSTDIALSPLGIQQMKNSIRLETLRAEQAPWDIIISSPRQRCWNVAEHVSEQLKIPIRKENNLREIHFGQWDGLSAKEIEEQDPKIFQRYIDNPFEFTPPEGENVHDFRARVRSSFDEIKTTHLDQRILIVTHSGVLRSILCDILNSPASTLFSIDCPYACYSQVKHYYHPQQQSDQLITHNSRLEHFSS